MTLLLALAAVFTACSGGKADEAGQRADSIPLMVMQIQKRSRLYTAECRVHKIITHDDDVRLKGRFMQQDYDFGLPLTSRKIAIPVDATLKAYIDFGEFGEGNVSRRGEKIEITLPDPKVELTSSRINHEEIKKHVSLLRSNFSDAELAGYERQGREQILKSIPGIGILDMARESAANILIPMVKQAGFKEENITITFRRDPSSGDVPFTVKDMTLENGRK